MGNEPRSPRGSAPSDPQGSEARLARARSKRELFTRLLLEHGSVAVRLDARCLGVQVPRVFSEDQSLTLDIWWKAPDAPMKLNERGVAATLRFDGERFRCLIPWTAVWGIRNPRQGTLQVWEADLPVELGGLPIPDGLEEEPVEPRPRLVHMVPAHELPSAPPDEQPDPPRPPLRIVK